MGKGTASFDMNDPAFKHLYLIKNQLKFQNFYYKIKCDYISKKQIKFIVVDEKND